MATTTAVRTEERAPRLFYNSWQASVAAGRREKEYSGTIIPSARGAPLPCCAPFLAPVFGVFVLHLPRARIARRARRTCVASSRVAADCPCQPLPAPCVSRRAAPPRAVRTATGPRAAKRR